MATQRTWANIAEYVTEFDKREGAEPNRDLYRVLGDEALAIMSRITPLYKTSWDNDAGGSLTLTSATCPLPIDLLSLLAVEYDGSDNPLERASVEWLDKEEPGWREGTGDPDKYAIEGYNLVLNSIPSSATGKLVLRGTACLPQFSDTTGATNPLTYVPWEFQLLPREYIISRMPMVSVTPQNDSAGAVQWAVSEMQRRTAVRKEASEAWERGLTSLQAQYNRRRFRDFKF